MDLYLAQKVGDEKRPLPTWGGGTYDYYTYGCFKTVHDGSWDGTRWAIIKDIWDHWLSKLEREDLYVSEECDYCRPKDLIAARKMLDEATAEDFSRTEGDKELAYELLEILEKHPDYYIRFSF